MPRDPHGSQLTTDVWVVESDRAEQVPDNLAVEEPLEIRLAQDGGWRAVAVTLRTPGADEELATGFLYAEGVIQGAEDLASVEMVAQGQATSPAGSPGGGGVVHVRLQEGLDPDLSPLERHFYTSSACGLCGKSSLDSLLLSRNPELPRGPRIEGSALHGLPEALRGQQGLFRSTGGIHAAGLFTAAGELVALREDVGRHNALDKLIGWALREDKLPLHDHIILVSGRASYELVQKCLMAEAPILCSVSAPSSAAVATARRHGITLIGFLRDKRFNVYAGASRLGLEQG